MIGTDKLKRLRDKHGD